MFAIISYLENVVQDDKTFSFIIYIKYEKHPKKRHDDSSFCKKYVFNSKEEITHIAQK